MPGRPAAVSSALGNDAQAFAGLAPQDTEGI